MGFILRKMFFTAQCSWLLFRFLVRNVWPELCKLHLNVCKCAIYDLINLLFKDRVPFVLKEEKFRAHSNNK